MGANSDDHDESSSAYWLQLGAEGASKKAGQPVMPEESDPADPLALIVQALRDNADAVREMAAESVAARQAMTEATRGTALRADAASAEMRSLTLAVQNLTASQSTLERLKSDRYLWGLGGAMIGAVLTGILLTELPVIWRQIFG